MIGAIRNILSIPDLRKRILFTLGMLAVFRIGGQIPTPGIDGKALAEFFETLRGSFLGLVDLFSGGNMAKMTIFALGVMPYISAAIIMELLTVVSPYIERLSKEGEYGRKKITEYTRYGTVLVCIIQSMGIAIGLEKMTTPGGAPIVTHPGWGFRLLTVLTLTTGSIFLMWLGEQITERGIGNGISLLIFAGIIIRLPADIKAVYRQVITGEISVLRLIFLLILFIGVIAVVVYVERAYRRVPIQYAKRVVGRRIYGGQSTHLPIKVNTGGVIPIIFASSIVSIPSAFGNFVKNPTLAEIIKQLNWGMPLYNLIYFAAIIFFTYFYVSIIFNPADVADNVRKYGGFVPGIRPGKPTADYIDRILSRLTFVGAIYLGLIAILPEFLIVGFKVGTIPGIGPWLEKVLPEWFTTGLGIQFYFGGTSLLIMVGVAMDTLQQIEAQLVMRHYDGFIKGVRIRGRR